MSLPFEPKHRKHFTPDFFATYNAYKAKRILEIDLTQDFQAPESGTYESAYVIVKIEGDLLGVIALDLPLNKQDFLNLVWQRFRVDLEDKGLSNADLTKLSKPLKAKIIDTTGNQDELISVIIATRDRVEYLASCLQSLVKQSYQNFEIIIVDNAPNTNATEQFIKHDFISPQNITYIREEIPGLAHAHNVGLKSARGSIVAITDDDVVLDSNWLSKLYEAFKLDNDIACVSGLILPFELDTPAQYWLEQYGIGKGFKRKMFNVNDSTDPLFPYTAGTIGGGANMAFRTKILKSLGGFDPVLGAGTIATGGDDLAAFYSVLNAGYSIIYEPQAYLYHRYRSDYQALRKQAYLYGVGLTAYLSKLIFDKPLRLFDMIWRMPKALKYVQNPNSEKNKRREDDYPAELSKLEKRGMIIGPYAFLYSYLKNRKLKVKTWPKLKQTVNHDAGFPQRSSELKKESQMAYSSSRT